MDDIGEQALRWLSAQVDAILVGGDQDDSGRRAGIIGVDPSWQFASKDTRYSEMIPARFLKER
jgi:hypothetical protein